MTATMQCTESIIGTDKKIAVEPRSWYYFLIYSWHQLYGTMSFLVAAFQLGYVDRGRNQVRMDRLNKFWVMQ